jgi:hypothetical protein
MPDHHTYSTSDTADLRRVLGEIQRRGAIGRVDLGDAIEHADRYAAAVPSTARTAIDLGSGGGLPGLVIAVRCPDVALTLVERRAKRADLLRYGVRALGLAARVTVLDVDVAVLMGDPDRERVDLVTARSFAPLPQVLEVARQLLSATGVCVVSTPPLATEPPRVPGWTGELTPGGVWVFHVEPIR